ncbi:choline ABC transporter permease subunit [Thalassolituus sp. TMPB967]|jgi:glycine betaine/proline transport system permease protein|uniref:choline ABC transporter permease subunit n=1 Tax=Oceanospirillaceae TaxID=135620 RepID=UPI001195A27D|nr:MULTISPECIES: choline ABC transporter permease subunit [Thalassolituus]MCA6059760.1 choline ABC transporter permease subunit [Thalassolituus sp. ST750PaO-4]MCB2387017.1 choline ABC transporter permease subunit [Thalassolituus alkanivorans]MCB2424970.1 choline ABC transporter permease subunit [Thalassolituus alkanivorans]TVV39606.1 choline ABC transporter permease subunit [Thalassolituus sp. C2-1]
MDSFKIPLGEYIELFFDWLVDNTSGFFDAMAESLEWLINSSTDALTWMHPGAFIVVLALFAFWLHRSVGLVLYAVASLLLIWNLGYWVETMQTLSLVLYATLFCILLGLPIGIYAAHHPRLYTVLRPVLDLMQTVPPFVYLIPTLTLFGLGVVPGLISTIIFAIAAPVRLTYLGISEVPKEMVEAGQSFGATRSQLLWRIELPAAAANIAAGVTQCIMLSLSMVVIAALVGADGLGKPVVRALNTVDIASGFEAGLAIVLLAILLDRLCKQREQVS